MSTVIRPEITKKKEYYIPKHRLYELKHYVQQYPEYKKQYDNALYGFQKQPPPDYIFIDDQNVTKPTEKMALHREFWSNKMKVIDQAAIGTDPVIGPMIVQNIIDDTSWDTCKDIVPCCRVEYYQLYHKFFWLLSRSKGL